MIEYRNEYGNKGPKKFRLPDWAPNAVFVGAIVCALVGFIWLVAHCETEGREECPSCERQVRPKVYHDMKEGISHWKCTKCWFPIRTKEIKEIKEIKEEATTNGVQEG